MSSSTDRFLRKFVPSTAKISYNPVLKRILNAPDMVVNIFFPEFRGLPPNHLRVRVGVSNNLFTNQIWYFIGAKDFWLYALGRSWVNFDSTIVDIGCGRFAWHFRDYDYNGHRFRGKYIGIDIDPEIARLEPPPF